MIKRQIIFQNPNKNALFLVLILVSAKFWYKSFDTKKTHKASLAQNRSRPHYNVRVGPRKQLREQVPCRMLCPAFTGWGGYGKQWETVDLEHPKRAISVSFLVASRVLKGPKPRIFHVLWWVWSVWSYADKWRVLRDCLVRHIRSWYK